MRAGASKASALFLQAGVTVAVGHCECGYAQAREAFLAGARLLTHALNAMPGIQHRP